MPKDTIESLIRKHIAFVQSFKPKHVAFMVMRVRKGNEYTVSAMDIECQKHMDKTVERIKALAQADREVGK